MPQEYELNLRDYWNIFLKRKWIIILAFLAIFLTTVIHTNLQPILYKAVALIKIEPAVSSILPEGYKPMFWTLPDLSDYVKQITSHPILSQALRELELPRKDATPQEIDNLVSSTIVGKLWAEPIKESSMIRIEMVSLDPRLATKIVNKITEVLKQENIKLKNQQARNVREFIEKQLEITSAKIKQIEEKLQVLTIKGIGVSITSITNKMMELESRRADLLTKFTELHPDVKKAEEQTASLKEQLKALPKEEFEFSDLKAELEFHKGIYDFLRKRLQEAQIKESEKIDNVVLISPAVPPQSPFSPNKPMKYLTGFILGIIFGVSIGLVFEHLDTSIGRIEDLESITKISVIGVIPYYIEKGKEIKERFRKRGIFSRRRVTRQDRARRLQQQLIIRHRETSIFTEAFRILGANIQVVFGENGKIKRKAILITSSNPDEGKTNVAANLSVILAQMGYKTILVDLDLRRSAVHKMFGLDSKEKGVTDILTGEISLESAVRTVTDLLLGEMGHDELLKLPWIDNLHLLTAGTTFPNSPYLLNTERMDNLLKVLREKYDVVIMDSSPVLAVGDTSIIISKIDGVILVYRAGATSRLALRRAKTQAESVKGKGAIKGIVLNNVTPEVSMDTYYYYYRRKYYAYKEKES